MRTVAPEKERLARGGHDANFKPAKNPRERLYKQSYEYIPQMEGLKPKHPRDEEGKPIAGPRNFTAVPMKRGKVGKLTTFAGPIPYIPDPYDTKKKIAWGEYKHH